MELLATVQQIGYQGDSDSRSGIAQHVVEARGIPDLLFRCANQGCGGHAGKIALAVASMLVVLRVL